MTLHLLINPHMTFMDLKLLLSKQTNKKRMPVSHRINIEIKVLRIKFKLLNKVMLPCFQLSPLTLGWKRKLSEMEQVKRGF